MGDSQESANSVKGNKRALGMQDWTMWPHYLNEGLWSKIMDHEGCRSLDVLHLLVSHLHGLGLRHPSEPTQASLTAALILREPEASQRKMLGKDTGRSLYLTVKASVHSKMQKLKYGEPQLGPADYILELPAQVTAAPASLQAACSTTAVPRIEMLEILKTAKQIPLRNTSKELRVDQGQQEPCGFEAEFRRWIGALTMFSGMQRQESQCPVQLLEPPRKPLADMLQRAQCEVPARPHASAPLALTYDGGSGHAARVHVCEAAAPVHVPGEDAQVSAPPDAAPVPLQSEAEVAPMPQTEANDACKKLSLMESVGRYQQAKAEGKDKVAKSQAVNVPTAPVVESVEPEGADRKALGQSGQCLKRPARKEASKPSPKGKCKSKPSPKATASSKASKTSCTAALKGRSKAGSKASESKSKPSKSKGKRTIVTGEAKQEFLKRIPAKYRAMYKSGCSTCRWAADCTVSCWKKRGW